MAVGGTVIGVAADMAAAGDTAVNNKATAVMVDTNSKAMAAVAAMVAVRIMVANKVRFRRYLISDHSVISSDLFCNLYIIY